MSNLIRFEIDEYGLLGPPRIFTTLCLSRHRISANLFPLADIFAGFSPGFHLLMHFSRYNVWLPPRYTGSAFLALTL